MKNISYLLGDCDTNISRVNSDENSFRPSFQHVFDEEFPRNYLKIKSDGEGVDGYMYFDMSARRFLTPSEVIRQLKNADHIIE